MTPLPEIEELDDEVPDLEEADDDVPALEEAGAGEGAGAGAGAAQPAQAGEGAVQNRAEKKSRKAVQKLGMRPVPGVARMSVKKAGQVLFVIARPEVYKS